VGPNPHFGRNMSLFCDRPRDMGNGYCIHNLKTLIAGDFAFSRPGNAIVSHGQLTNSRYWQLSERTMEDMILKSDHLARFPCIINKRHSLAMSALL